MASPVTTGRALVIATFIVFFASIGGGYYTYSSLVDTESGSARFQGATDFNPKVATPSAEPVVASDGLATTTETPANRTTTGNTTGTESPSGVNATRTPTETTTGTPTETSTETTIETPTETTTEARITHTETDSGTETATSNR